jgi:protein TonB
MPLALAVCRGTCLTAILFLAPAFGQAPSARPIEKEALFGALRLCPSNANELIPGIQANGVDFRLTAGDEQALLSLKADPKLLDAIRANYRSPAAQEPLPDGPPLTFNDVIGLLQAHRDEAWIASLLQKRGVDSPVTLQRGRTILAAGGSMGLIGVIVLNQQESVLSAAAPGANPALKAVELTRDELARKLRRRVAPEYPLQARRLALVGSVVLEVQIDQAGELKAFGKVSGHPILVDAAKNAVRRWQWEPTFINRTPVEVHSEVVVEFVR